MRFRNRSHAGDLLADRLKGLPLERPLVLGIPRGGVVVAASLASALRAEMDVVIAHKLRFPYQPEWAIGAVGESGELYLNPDVVRATGVTRQYLEEECRQQLAEISRRSRLFRRVRSQAEVSGRSVILTDDGIATGSTLMAAIEVVQSNAPSELVVAVPVAPADRVPAFKGLCDRLVCLHPAEDFGAVGQFYDSFWPVTDAEAVAILSNFAASSPDRKQQAGGLVGN